jgi:hypothetical protein
MRTDEVQRITASDQPPAFTAWLKQLIGSGLRYEIIINDGLVTCVYVDEPDNGDLSDVKFGRVVGCGTDAFKQKA